MQRLHVVLLALLSVASADVVRWTSDTLYESLKDIQSDGAVVVTFIQNESEYGKGLRTVMEGADKVLKQRVIMGWGVMDDLTAVLDSYQVVGEGDKHGMFMLFKNGKSAMFKDNDTPPSAQKIIKWVVDQLDSKAVDVGPVKTCDDSEFSSIVFLPSRTAVVIFDTEEVSPLSKILSKAAESFPKQMEDKSLSFVRATSIRTPQRFDLPEKSDKAPVIYFYGRRKAKYSPKKYTGPETEEALRKWVDEMTGSGKVERVKDMPIPEITDDTFEPVLKTLKRGMLVMFHAPWCGHCKRMMPAWDSLADHMRSEKEILIAKMDATEHKATSGRYGVSGFPTIKFITPSGAVDEYSGDRSLEAMKQFVFEKLGKPIPGDEPTEVAILRDDNFDDLVTKSDKGVFVKFYAPWCGHCKRMAPDWEALGKHFKGDKDVTIAKLDAQRYKAGNGFGITGFPTIMWFPKGDKAHPVKYSSGRDYSTMKAFVTKQIAGTGEVEEKVEKAASEGALGVKGSVLELTDVTFKQLTDGSGSKGSLVMFYATWCGHCKKLHPDYSKLATHFQDQFDKYVVLIH